MRSLLLAVALMAFPTGALAQERPGYASFDLGLYPVCGETNEVMDALVELAERGPAAQDFELEAGTWRRRPEYRAYLLYYVMGWEPLLRIWNPYVGDWVLRSSDLSSWLKPMEMLRVEPHTPGDLERLRTQATYRSARSWERKAMETALEVSRGFNEFERSLVARVQIDERSLATIPHELRAEVVREVERSLPSGAPLRVTVDGDRLILSRLFSFKGGEVETFEAAAEYSEKVGEANGDAERQLSEAIASALLVARDQIRAISTLEQSIGESKLAARSSAMGELLSKLKRKKAELESAAGIWKEVPKSERFRLWVKRLSFRPLSVETRRGQNAVAARTAGRFVRWAGEVAVWAALLDAFWTQAESLYRAGRDSDPHQLDAEFARTLVVGGSFLGLAKLGRLSKTSSVARIGSLWFLGLDIATAVSRQALWSDTPTFSDGINILAEDLKDVVRMVRSDLGGNEAKRDFLAMKEKYFDGLSIQTFEEALNDPIAEVLGRAGVIRDYSRRYLQYLFLTLQTLGSIDRNGVKATLDGSGCPSLVREKKQRDEVLEEVVDEIQSFITTARKLDREPSVQFTDQEFLDALDGAIREIEECAEEDLYGNWVPKENCKPTAEALAVARELRRLRELLLAN